MEFIYTDKDNKIVITSVKDPMEDVIVIPNKIDGKPVTKIGEYSFENCQKITKIILPESITEIGKWAFNGCNDLIEIYLPDSIQRIGRNAFSDCVNLRSITIPCKLRIINNSVFSGCRSLTKIYIPSNIDKIDWYAYVNCTSLTTIEMKNGISVIGGAAFKNCVNLKSITIPNSVAEIGLNAFEGCNQLESIDVNNENLLYSSRDGVLYDQSLLTLICFPAGKSGIFVIPNGTRVIKHDAFWGCINLTGVTVPFGLTQIGDHAFNGCDLTSITIPDSIEKIGAGAFGNCPNLSSVMIIGDKKDELQNLLELKKCIANKEINYFSGSVNAFEYLLDQKQKLKIILSYCKDAKGYNINDKRVFDSYISKHLMEIAAELIHEESIAGLNYLSNTKKITSKNIDKLIEIANKSRTTQSLLFLMDYKNNTTDPTDIIKQFKL